MRRTFSVWLLCLLAVTHLTAQEDTPRHWVNIVFMGNSITQGVLLDNARRESPPVRASIYLKKQAGVGEVKYINRGVSGSTTFDFLPETGTLFHWTVEAAQPFKEDTWARLIFSIMLGTNDSASDRTNGAPVAPETYRQNLITIINGLFENYPGSIIVLNRPLWYSPNTHNSARYLEEGLQRLDSYLPEIKAVVDTFASTHPGQVWLGDTEAYDYFKEHHTTLFIPEEGNSGIFYLHPNAEGAAKLGEFWGKAIYNVLIQLTN